MAINGGLSATAILVLVSDGLRAIDHGEVPWWDVCRGLGVAFGGATVAYVELLNDRQECKVRAWSAPSLAAHPPADLPRAGPLREEDPALLLRHGSDRRTWQERLGRPGSSPSQFAIVGIPVAQLDAHALVVTLVRADAFTADEMDALEDLRLALAPFQMHVRLWQSHVRPRCRQVGDHPGDVSPPPLTRREIQVLELLSEGLLATTIAARLAVSDRTVHAHLGSAYRKLSTHDRLSAVNIARDWGLLSK
ncbi:MAG: helix-turn-helix transcriptional regulator [Microbacteriaceae bacterium]